MSPPGWASLATAAAATLLTTGTLGSPAAVPADDASCSFRINAVHVLAELDGDTGPRATRLRRLLVDAGVGKSGFVPTSCDNGGTNDDETEDPDTRNRADGSGRDGHCPRTAAGTLGWGAPNRESGFNGSAPDEGWSLYDGPGHAGNGRRTPSAVSVADGGLTITGTADGDAEGLAWNPGQKYGRWELCVRSPQTQATSMHSLALLWPDDEGNSPDEVDFMEIGDPARQKVEMFLHHPGGQDHGELDIDATAWHAFAVEWTPEAITNFVDGRPWWRTTDTAHLPRGPMHMTIQLDYFGGPAAGAKEHVDWARQYPLADGTGGEAGNQEADGLDDQGSERDTGTGTSS